MRLLLEIIRQERRMHEFRRRLDVKFLALKQPSFDSALHLLDLQHFFSLDVVLTLYRE
jgi:hypothetical protein